MNRQTSEATAQAILTAEPMPDWAEDYPEHEVPSSPEVAMRIHALQPQGRMENLLKNRFQAGGDQGMNRLGAYHGGTVIAS